MISVKENCITKDQSILDAIQIINASDTQIALVIDSDSKLLGTVTDGDIRRGILAGIKLEEAVSLVMNATPQTARAQASKSDLISMMSELKIHQIPLLDEHNKLVGLVHIDDLLKQQKDTVQVNGEDVNVVLMLGGRGERLMPLTEDTPKPMLELGKKPLLETIVRRFIDQGFRKFYFSVRYKSHVIENYFGDGSRFGIKITYLHEDKPLGTAGALSLLPRRPKNPLIVMNGDILTTENFAQLIDFHQQNKALATMCVREYQQQVPYGIVQADGTSLKSITEKPSYSHFVNAGIYVLNPDALDFIPSDNFFDMPDLFAALQENEKLSSVFPIREYWSDIGSPEDLAKARSDFSKYFAA